MGVWWRVLVKGMGGPAGGEEARVFPMVMSLSDMVLGFFEEDEGCSKENYSDAGDDGGSGDDVSENSGGGDVGADERKAFWESQHQLLQTVLSRNSSLESKIRRDTEAVLRQLQLASSVCSCSRNVAVKECRNCMLREISERLRGAGHNSALCKSKWRSSQDIPSGEHSYVDVVADTASTKRGPARVVIEISFRAEFEMARATGDYNGVVSRLPEVFVGKSEKLRSVIKIVCAAAKKCMADNKMHMGPWRKQKYMQAKWLSPWCERVLLQGPPLQATTTAAGFSDRPPQPAAAKRKASLLTFDLLQLETLPSLHCTAVEVVYINRMINMSVRGSECHQF